MLRENGLQLFAVIGHDSQSILIGLSVFLLQPIPNRFKIKATILPTVARSDKFDKFFILPTALIKF